MGDSSQFEFTHYNFDPSTLILRCDYTVKKDNTAIFFQEYITFPKRNDHQYVPTPLFDRICQNIFLILGVSYWKIYCPKTISIVPFTLTKEQSDFWNSVYTKGLGEFFYKNAIDYRNLIYFPYTDMAVPNPIVETKTDRSLLLFGGGKDSLVSASLLKNADKTFHLMTLNGTDLHTRLSEKISIPMIAVQRTLDPKLNLSKRQPNSYQGHVPISAIYSWVSLAAAVLYDYRFVVASNEDSANYGSTVYLGSEINHQWSKSYEYEQLLQRYIQSFVTPSLKYFSLLRPLTEFYVVSLFSHLPQYFADFTSCNSTFRLIPHNSAKLWCGHCPKCAFVFLMLSAFLSKNTLTSIFKKNLFDDPALLNTFEELLGIKGVKPFDCVGTPLEANSAFSIVSQNKEYMNHPVILALSKKVKFDARAAKEGIHQILRIKKIHSIPQSFDNVSSTL